MVPASSDHTESKPPARKRRRRVPTPHLADLEGIARLRSEPTTHHRLGWGGLASPEVAATIGRRQFFLTLDRMVPDVLLTLLEAMQPAFRDFFESSIGSVEEGNLPGLDTHDDALGRIIRFCGQLPGPWPGNGLLSFQKLVASLDVCPLLVPVHEALLSWAPSWALTDEWCLDIALCTLLHQQLKEYLPLTSNARDVRWESPSPRWPSPTGSVPGFSFALGPEEEIVASESGTRHRLFTLLDPYDPVFETREEADLRLSAAFRQELNRYFDQVEASYPDCRPTQLVRQAYFGWLVAYQCLNMDFADIARLETYTREGVAGGARELAALIGLTMRPPNRGRPSGARDTHERWRRR